MIFELTPRVYASGETEQIARPSKIGRIAKCGDGMVRWLLYDAANAMADALQKRQLAESMGSRCRPRSRHAQSESCSRASLGRLHTSHRMLMTQTPFSMEKSARR